MLVSIVNQTEAMTTSEDYVKNAITLLCEAKDKISSEELNDAIVSTLESFLQEPVDTDGMADMLEGISHIVDHQDLVEFVVSSDDFTGCEIVVKAMLSVYVDIDKKSLLQCAIFIQNEVVEELLCREDV